MKKQNIKHKKLRIFLRILIIIVDVFVIVNVVSAIRSKTIVINLEKENVTMIPTIDFVQPYLFAHEEGESFDYDKYFTDLKKIGYDSIIVQMTRDELEDGSSRFYYPTSIPSEMVTAELSMSYILEEFLTACDLYNFEVYIGLSVEEYSWWALTCYYDETYMNHCADVDCYMVKEIYDLFNHHQCFIGWYYAFELFSNPVGWEKLWAKNVNKVIAAVDELNDGRPILLSPFRQIILGNFTNEYAMWKSFFKRTNFRSIDIFCPQDSIGKLDSSNKSFKKIYDYLNATSKACKEAGLKYYVNCELFNSPDNGAHLYVSDISRVSKQIKNAGRVAEKLVTFSASHYLIEQGSVDEAENRAKFYKDYLEFINTKK